MFKRISSQGVGMWSFNDTEEEKSVYPFVKTTSEHPDNETERTLAVSWAWPRGKTAPDLMFTDLMFSSSSGTLDPAALSPVLLSRPQVLSTGPH